MGETVLKGWNRFSRRSSGSPSPLSLGGDIIAFFLFFFRSFFSFFDPSLERSPSLHPAVHTHTHHSPLRLGLIFVWFAGNFTSLGELITTNWSSCYINSFSLHLLTKHFFFFLRFFQKMVSQLLIYRHFFSWHPSRDLRHRL